jgi:hypothetical protein
MELKYVNCPTNVLDIKDLQGIELFNDYLFINQERFLSIWDVKDPTDLQKVAEFPFPGLRQGMKLFGNKLYVYGKSLQENEPRIHILDISNPLKIKQEEELRLRLDDKQIYSVSMCNGQLLEDTALGIYNCDLKKLLCENTDKHGYGCDVISSDEWLIFSGQHEGVRVFRILPDNNVELVKHISTQTSMPFGLSWEEQNKSFLIVGPMDESVLKFDMSVPQKTKRGKGLKTKIGLCTQFARERGDIYVLGTAIESRQHSPALGVIDVSGAIPELKYKQSIKEYKEKNVGSDEAKGIVKIGKYLLLATYHCQLCVVEIV